MKAKNVVVSGPRKDFETVEANVPEAQNGEVLVKVSYCGVCGTDVHVWEGNLEAVPYPLVMGHEIVGTIDQLGKGVESDVLDQPLEEGDLVYVLPLLACGECYFCKVLQDPTKCVNQTGYGFNPYPDRPYFHGGYSQYLYADFPGTGFLKMETIKPEVGVTLEPLSIGVHAVDRVDIPVGSTVVIQGPGPIGIFTLVAAKEAGAEKTIVIGAPKSRLKLAEEFGADMVIDIEKVPEADKRIEMVKKETTGGYGADIVFECTGVPSSVPEGLEMTRTGGSFGEVGHFTDTGDVEINPFTHLCNKHVNLIGVWSSTITHFTRAKAILERDEYPFDEYVSHQISLDQIHRYFQAISNGEYQVEGKELRKVIIDPWS